MATSKKTTPKEETKTVTKKATVAKKVEPSVKKTTAKKTVAKKATVTNTNKTTIVNLTFEIRFTSHYGQNLFIIGDHELLGNNDMDKAVPMFWLNDKTWAVTFSLEEGTLPTTPINYRYFVKNSDGSIIEENIDNKVVDLTSITEGNVFISDFWSFAGFPVARFETKPFEVLLNKEAKKTKTAAKATHLFTIKAPVVKENQVVVLLGDDKKIGAWEVKKAIKLSPVEHGNWQVALDLSKANFPIHYKYGLLDKKTGKLDALESYENRYCSIPAGAKVKVYVNEGLINITENA